jgi:hypothetical protein
VKEMGPFDKNYTNTRIPAHLLGRSLRMTSLLNF